MKISHHQLSLAIQRIGFRTLHLSWAQATCMLDDYSAFQLSHGTQRSYIPYVKNLHTVHIHTKYQCTNTGSKCFQRCAYSTQADMTEEVPTERTVASAVSAAILGGQGWPRSNGVISAKAQPFVSLQRIFEREISTSGFTTRVNLSDGACPSWGTSAAHFIKTAGGQFQFCF